MSTEYGYTAHAVGGTHNSGHGHITANSIEEAVQAVKDKYMESHGVEVKVTLTLLKFVAEGEMPQIVKVVERA
ncbi:MULTISPECIES: hypothetical protein [Pseudomonas]|uniref:hypothetical protein n=1 Tax=Pseudomonas TaxID=286 RepID=UPI000A6BB787|nr:MULTISPECIES: hypothetical protein [Pseudomonas]MCE0461080.1 hypothetical protein [Pseudomonas uvaldensis]